LVLVNGEKFNPVAMEGTVRSNKNIAEVVVFGAGRPSLGMLIVPGPSTAGKTESEILDIIWPVVETANETADGFAQISRSMIKLLPHECEYPRTDKGSIIRQAFYKTYDTEIQEVYDAADMSSSGDGGQEMDISELRGFIRQLARTCLSSVSNFTDDEDFFMLGLDSLQAIQMRSEIIKTVDVGGQRLGQNVVFENPSVQKLSGFLLGLRLGESTDKYLSVEQEMQALIEKYATDDDEVASQQSTVVSLSPGCQILLSSKLTRLNRL
jgi:aryl carrier-like protein